MSATDVSRAGQLHNERTAAWTESSFTTLRGNDPVPFVNESVFGITAFSVMSSATEASALASAIGRHSRPCLGPDHVPGACAGRLIPVSLWATGGCNLLLAMSVGIVAGEPSLSTTAPLQVAVDEAPGRERPRITPPHGTHRCYAGMASRDGACLDSRWSLRFHRPGAPNVARFK